MGLKGMFFDLDESVIGAMPDFSLQMLPFLLVSFKRSILRIRALTVCKERFVFFPSKTSQKAVRRSTII